MKAVLEFNYPQDTDRCRRHPRKEQHMKIAWTFIIVMLTLMTLRSIYA